MRALRVPLPGDTFVPSVLGGASVPPVVPPGAVVTFDGASVGVGASDAVGALLSAGATDPPDFLSLPQAASARTATDSTIAVRRVFRVILVPPHAQERPDGIRCLL